MGLDWLGSRARLDGGAVEVEGGAGHMCEEDSVSGAA